MTRSPPGQRWQMEDKPNSGAETLQRPKTQKPSMYHVVMLNDDFTPMEFVIAMLRLIFHRNQPEAEAIMMEVHLKGKGIAGTYTLEVAEMKAAETMARAQQREYPLQCTIERAD